MNTPQLLKEIGKQLSIMRLRSGMTQFALNRYLHFPEGRIGKLEKGELNITLETMAAIADKCGCRIEIKFRKIRGNKEKVSEEEDDSDVPEAIIRMRNAALIPE